MTIKEMFEKVESYNEIAEMMLSCKVKIHFCTLLPGTNLRYGNSFSDYDSFSKYISDEYFDSIANLIMEFSGWDFDTETKFEYTDYWGDHIETFCADLVAAF